MMRRLAGLLGALILACAPLAALDASELLTAADLARDARQANQAGGPLIVLYSRDDCKFCKAVKRDFLQPLTDNPRYRDRIVVREVRQDGDNQALVDFKGQTTTHARLAAAEKVKLVPVVAFYGPDGRKLADPIVGTRLPDFYQSYLEDAIEQSSRNLKKP